MTRNYGKCLEHKGFVEGLPSSLSCNFIVEYNNGNLPHLDLSSTRGWVWKLFVVWDCSLTATKALTGHLHKEQIILSTGFSIWLPLSSLRVTARRS